MPRQLQSSDVVVLSNRDGHFVYIRPDIPRARADEVVHGIERSDTHVALRVRSEVTYGRDVLIENVRVKDAYHAIYHSGDTNDHVENLNFFGIKDDELFGAALYRDPTDQGELRYLRVFADGGVSPMPNAGGYSTTNTDFFNNGLRPADASPNEYVMMRDITAKNFSDAIFDSRSTIYIMNATLENAFRLLRPWRDSEIVLVNSEVNLGPEGSEYIFFNSHTGRIRYYNTTWDGKRAPDFHNIGFTRIDRSDRVDVYRNNIIELDKNPLPAISDFFAVDTNRYRAQISVNGGTWRELTLPEDGWLGRHVGDTLIELPDLGNGVYRVRAWTVDGAPTTPVVSAAIVVRTSSFDYVRGVPGNGGSLAQPFAATGTAEADRLFGDAAANTITGLSGHDTITGGLGNDLIYGGDGDDLLSGDAGNDTMFSGAGNDTLSGGLGNDVLVSGAGRKRLVGGDGLDTADFRHKPVIDGVGFIIDMRSGTVASRSAPTVAIDRFETIERVVDSAGDDIIVGNGRDNRLTSGRGNDVITGGGGFDTYIFDNREDIGRDRITDFTWGREIWLTHFTDLGSDGVVMLDDGRFWVDVRGTNSGNVQGDRAIDVGGPGNWFRYVGQNSEGFFVYTYLTGSRPSRDILPTRQYDGPLTGPTPLPSATPPDLPRIVRDPAPPNLPDASAPPPPPPAARLVEVFVAGTGGPDVGPAFEVYADGVLLGTGEVSDPMTNQERRDRTFDWERFAFTYEGATPSVVEVRYVNDGAERNGVDRNLLLDRIAVAGREFVTVLDSVYIPDRVENRDRVGETNEAFWNGRFVFATGSAGGELRVVAAGAGARGGSPSFDVIVDGVKIGGASIGAPVTNATRRAGDVNWETFIFELRDASPSQIRIVFVNDGTAPNGEDMNLLIDNIVVGNRTYEAEIDGFYTPVNPNNWHHAGPTTMMAWNGDLVFDFT